MCLKRTRRELCGNLLWVGGHWVEQDGQEKSRERRGRKRRSTPDDDVGTEHEADRLATERCVCVSWGFVMQNWFPRRRRR